MPTEQQMDIEASYGPQPYDPTQGGAALFRGRVTNVPPEAEQVQVSVLLYDSKGDLVMQKQTLAKPADGGNWAFSIPWRPSNSEAPQGFYGPTFEATAIGAGVGEQIGGGLGDPGGGDPGSVGGAVSGVIIDSIRKAICNGIGTSWTPLCFGTGGNGEPKPPGQEGGHKPKRGRRPVDGGGGSGVNCNTHPWMPECWKQFPWHWDRDPRIDKPTGNPIIIGPDPPPTGPTVTPPKANPSTGPLCTAGTSEPGDGPGGSCKI